MSRGIAVFAHNNEAIDYATLAFCSLALAKRHLRVETALLADTDTISRLIGRFPPNVFGWVVDHIIEIMAGNTANRRRYGLRPAMYRNTTRVGAYDLTPFDETLLIDSDYLMLDGSLRYVWDSSAPILMNKTAISVMDFKPAHGYARIDPLSIDMFWATVVYFRRGDEARRLFDIVNHVQKHYQYYALLYRFDPNQFRNDFAFSIAAHLLNGEIGSPYSVGHLPVPHILTCFEPSGLHEVIDSSRMIFAAANADKRYTPVRVESNVHCMNKSSILAHADEIVRTAYEEA